MRKIDPNIGTIPSGLPRGCRLCHAVDFLPTWAPYRNGGPRLTTSHHRTSRAPGLPRMLQKPRKKLPPRHCKECRNPFPTTRLDRAFCSTSCRRQWCNRQKVRGGQLYDLAMKYRDERKKGAFSYLIALIDRYLDEDRRQGRKTYANNPQGLERQ